jgi:hypothetical protein
MWELDQSDRTVTMIWISSHVGIGRNKQADLWARQAISVELVNGRPLVARNIFQMQGESCFKPGSKSGMWKILVVLCTQ